MKQKQTQTQAQKNLDSLPAPDGCRVWWTVILKSEAEAENVTVLVETFQKSWFDARAEGMTALGVADIDAVMAFKTETYAGMQPKGPYIGWRELFRHMKATNQELLPGYLKVLKQTKAERSQ